MKTTRVKKYELGYECSQVERRIPIVPHKRQIRRKKTHFLRTHQQKPSTQNNADICEIIKITKKILYFDL